MLSIKLDDRVTKRLATVDKHLVSAVLKGADASAKMLGRYAVNHFVRGHMKPWMLTREKKVAASIHAYTRRFRGFVRSGSVVIDATGMRRRDARSIESGGRYEQWVTEHTRTRPARRRAGGFVSRRPGAVSVTGHRRMSPVMVALGPFERAKADLRSVITTPVARALQILTKEQRAARLPELLKGLPR